MLESARYFPHQIADALHGGPPPMGLGKPRRILILGTGGGSAMAGEVLLRIMDDFGRSPVDVCSDYRIPSWVGVHTLVFAVSHSGNTKEILAAALKARARSAKVVALTSGGELARLAVEHGWPIWTLPGGTTGEMPCAMLGSILGALVSILDHHGIAPHAKDYLMGALGRMRRGSQQREEEGRRVGRALRGHIPYVVGAEPITAVCAMRLKRQLAEHSKVMSLATVLPAAHHDEFAGWDQPTEMSKRYAAVYLRDPGEEKEIQYHFKATRAVLDRRVGRSIEIWAMGGPPMARMLSLIQTCDFVSVFTALDRDLDPTPAGIIDELKKAMRQ